MRIYDIFRFPLWKPYVDEVQQQNFTFNLFRFNIFNFKDVDLNKKHT